MHYGWREPSFRNTTHVKYFSLYSRHQKSTRTRVLMEKQFLWNFLDVLLCIINKPAKMSLVNGAVSALRWKTIDQRNLQGNLYIALFCPVAWWRGRTSDKKRKKTCLWRKEEINYWHIRNDWFHSWYYFQARLLLVGIRLLLEEKTHIVNEFDLQQVSDMIWNQ